jgi:N-acetylmuramoyl-L-alanine amidase CwlA
MKEIKTKLIPINTAARSGYVLKPKYITIHNTANTSVGADAENHAIYMQGSGKNSTASYHYVVDDKEIYRLLPDNEVAWHAGDGEYGTGNRQSLAIEICENVDGDLLKATNNAVELTAYLMKLYNIPLSNVVQHNYWSGKNCPNRIRKSEPYNWQTFLNKVQDACMDKSSTTVQKTLYRVRKAWNDTKSQIGAYADLNNAKRACDKAGKSYFVFDSSGKAIYPVSNFSSYRVKVMTDALNIRSGPSTQYKINNCIRDYGVYTIVEENNGFGRLKSGAGWICLDYTVRI